jgi:thymidylate synthase
MKTYIDQLRKIMTEGYRKQQRAILQSSDARPLVRALFGMQARYDLRAGFPLMTTKKMSLRQIAEELIWFLSGSTNNNDLLRRGVGIWRQWADKETGELGPIYGQPWRRWEYRREGKDETWDQIRTLVNNIKVRIDDPEAQCGRRLILTAWNPPDMPQAKGPAGCHTLAQFDVTEDRLSCQMYQRSADMLLGVPYNIASYALLTHLLARSTGLQVGDLIHTIGDAHIYEHHLPQVEEQLRREPHALPTLTLAAEVTDVDEFRHAGQATLSGYDPHPPLDKAEVAV